VGSVAGVQTSVQSGGSMADETIVRVCRRNLPPGSANVKSRIKSVNFGVFQESETLAGGRAD
jgi:hypothetical protein